MFDFLNFKNPKILILVLLFATFVAFAPIFANGWVNYDDPGLLFENTIIKNFSLGNTVEIFKLQFQGHYSRINPLVFTVYSAIHHVAGFNPLVYHLVSLLFHMGCVLLVFCLTGLLLKNNFMAFITAFLFAIHPIHVEPVAWASALTHVMYAFFYFAAIIFYVLAIQHPSKQGRYYSFCFFNFVIAGTCFSGGAFTLPILLIAVTYYLEQKVSKSRLIKLLPFFLLSIGLVFLTFHAAKNADIITNPYFNTQYSLAQKLHLSSFSLFKYVQAIVFPNAFCIVHPTGYFLKNYNFLFTLTGLALLGLIFWPQKSRKTSTLVIFGLMFFLIPLMPFLQFYSTSDSIINDRYAYVGAFGIFIILAYFLHLLLENLPKKSFTLAKCIVLSITGYLLILTWTQDVTWKNSEKLWTNVIIEYPRAYPAYVARAESYMELGLPKLALADLNRALILKPDFAPALDYKKQIVSAMQTHPSP